MSKSELHYNITCDHREYSDYYYRYIVCDEEIYINIGFDVIRLSSDYEFNKYVDELIKNEGWEVDSHWHYCPTHHSRKLNELDKRNRLEDRIKKM